MFQCKDRRIFDWRKLFVKHIQLTQHILACNLAENQSYSVDKRTQRLHLQHGKRNSIRLSNSEHKRIILDISKLKFG